MTMVSEIIANNLIALRKAEGLSQRQLAKKLNVSYTTIQNIENQRDFKVSTLFAICDYFSVNLSRFIKPIDTSRPYKDLFLDVLKVRDDFPEKLKQLRSEKSLTQSYMSSKLGISLRSYQRYEQGSRTPSSEILLAMCSILNVKPGDLYL